MSLVVITGAVRSGKSTAAERLAASRRRRVIVAVAGREADEEMGRRIAEHRAARPRDFEVREVGSDPAWVAEVPRDAVLVVECLGTLVGLAVGESTDASSSDAETLTASQERTLTERVDDLVAAICDRGGDTIVVTNEVGWGVVPAYPSGRVFRDLLGMANRRLVERADAAYLVVDGRCMDLRSLPSDPVWPADGTEDGA